MSPVVGYTYVNDNTVGVNSVAAFDRHADGSLTPIPGSPFAIGGAGLGKGLGSQGAIQATADGRFLLAVDAGSSQISVLRVTRGGVPVLVGRPISSAGVQPVSITVSGRGLVYVANVGDGGSNYTGFRLNEDGQLSIFRTRPLRFRRDPGWAMSCSTPPLTAWSARATTPP